MPEISTMVSSRLFYRKMGSGPALVLLHGFPASGDLWRRVWDTLAKSFTLIIPDFPGSGNSALDHYTSISDMADGVKSILDAEQITRAVVAGHSMGGYVALAFADRYGDMLAGLSLVHSFTLADDEEKKSVRLKAIDMIRKGGKKQFLGVMVPNTFSAAFKQSDPATVKTITDEACLLGDGGLINFYEAMIARRDTSYLLSAAPYPLQWICGADDTVISYKKILALCHKSGINFVAIYNDCGHMSMLEAPQRLTNDLVQFAGYCFLHHYETL